jgi:hypothetical protein
MAHATEAEEAELRVALYQSALEFSKQGQLHTEPISPELESFMLYQGIELVQLLAPDADTLVYIGAPPQQADQTYDTYARIAAHFANFHKIHSKNVLSSGSAKLERLLGQSSQFRIERRLRKQGILPGGKPHDIKYLLDLRPPSEDEDAIFLITELSCSKGILTWFKAQKKYDIPRTMVCGQDDASLLSKQSVFASGAQKKPGTWKKPVAPKKSQTQSSTSQAVINDDSSGDKDPKVSRIGNWEGVFPAAPAIQEDVADEEDEVQATADVDKGKEPSGVRPDGVANEVSTKQVDIQPEYSQLRHWSAIERLLHAIEGNDPMLDSAPKLWTFFAVATYFGCASNERVSGWITKWLFTAPNHNFIQCNPEVCYRIGLGIQSEDLLKDAFSLLVGEKALIDVRRDHSDVESFDPTVSVAGRKLGLLDEDELGRIAYVANIFTKRIQSKYATLVGQDMPWLQQSEIFWVLDAFVAHSKDEEDLVRQLKEDIKTFVRTRVLWVLVRSYNGDTRQIEQDPGSVRPFYPHASAHFKTYNQLNQEERVFTRLFWMALKDEEFHYGHNSVHTNAMPAYPSNDGYPDESSSSPVEGWSKLAKELRDGTSKNKLVMMHMNALKGTAAKFMKILCDRYWNVHSKTTDRTRPWDHGQPLSWEYVHNLAFEASSKMPNLEDATTDDVAKENSPAKFPLQYFETLHLSSPKRAHGADPFTDLGHEKRARLDPDYMHGSSDQVNRLKVDLPIRAAPPPTENNLGSSSGPKTEKAKQQAVENTGTFESEFAYKETKVPIANEAQASSPIIDARSVFGRVARIRMLKEKEREQRKRNRAHDFPMKELFYEITQAIGGICDEVLLAVHLFQDKEVPPTNLIDSLMCLDHTEWKYLPLWAGGNDDGTGGVYNDLDPPILEEGGFDGGKRGLGDRHKSSIAGSSNWSEVLSTLGRASKEANDGTATETATVQSLGDVDMDVKSIDDDDSVIRDSETVVGNDGGENEEKKENEEKESEDKKENGNEQDGGDTDMVIEDEDPVDVEEAEWDDCLV